MSAQPGQAYVGHSHDFRYEFDSDARLHEVERTLGMRGMLENLKDMGWDTYLWRNREDGKKSFVELSSSVYRDFRRADSTQGARQALEILLNQVQKVLRCERETGHDFTARPGYENGVLACKHCGFGGYESEFHRKTKEADHWKTCFEQAREEISKYRNRLGLGISFGGDVAVESKRIHPMDENMAGYTVLGDTDKVSFIVEKDPSGGQNETDVSKA